MLRQLIRRAAPCRLYATRQRRRVPPPVIDIESRIADVPPEQRKQILDQVHGELPATEHKEVRGDDFTANLIIEYIENAESPEDLDASFWKTVRGLAKSATRNRNPTYLDVFAALFEIAKKISDDQLRRNMLFIIGQYIYRQRQVRMDPVNEVEFLDMLVLNGRVFNALKYWRGRSTKPDMVDSVYWLEMGILYHIEAGLLQAADEMAIQMKDKFGGYIAPRALVELVVAYSNQIRRGRNIKTAKQRLNHWTNELMTVPYVSETSNTSEQSDPKLQEPKALTNRDLTRALSFIILAREWSLAAQVFTSWGEMDNRDLLNVLQLSHRSNQVTEESIMPFIDAILTQNPERVSDERVTAAIVLSFARAGDLEDMVEILKDIKARGIELSDSSQAIIARAILREEQSNLETSISIIKECLTCPSAARVVIQHLRHKKAGDLLIQFWDEYQGKVTSSLALEVLRSQSIRDDEAVLKLGVSSETWKYLWYLIGSRKLLVAPRFAFKKMVHAADNGVIGVTPDIMALALPAIVVASPNPTEGAVEALAALRIAGKKYNMQATSALSTVYLHTVRRLLRGQVIWFTPPRVRDTLQEELVVVPWEEFVSSAEAISETEGLDQRAKAVADDFLA